MIRTANSCNCANSEPIQERNRQQENDKFYSNLIKSDVSLNTVELEPEFYSVNVKSTDPSFYIRHSPFTKNELKGKASQRISQLG